MAEQIGWYDELQQNDWFRAAKDVSDQVGEIYEQNKFGMADKLTNESLSSIEKTSQTGVQTGDISKNQLQVSGNGTTNYLLIGVAGFAALGILVLALKG